MEPWRLIATVLMTAVGAGLILSTATKLRESRPPRPGSAARASIGGLSVLAVFDLLTATFLPAMLCWALIAAGILIASILMITG